MRFRARRSTSGRSAFPSTLVALGAAYLTAAVSWRQGALFLVGAGAGVVLYHAAFGFTSSWRAMIAAGRGDGLRAHMLMLAVTCAVFLPVLAHGHIFGQPVRGAVAPVGISVLVGAFLFGVGMQLGGGCASGTLYTVGRWQRAYVRNARRFYRRFSDRRAAHAVLGGRLLRSSRSRCCLRFGLAGSLGAQLADLWGGRAGSLAR